MRTVTSNSRLDQIVRSPVEGRMPSVREPAPQRGHPALDWNAPA